MGSFTAQVLVGTPHPYHGGIIPSHSLLLSENSRPAWVLDSEDSDPRSNRFGRVTWIPTLEHPVDDAILMIAIHVTRDSALLARAKSFCNDIDGERVVVYDALDEVQRQELYESCRSLADLPKLAVSVYEGSLIAGHIQVLETYGMEVEVCPVAYSRLYSQWRNEGRTKGSLADIHNLDSSRGGPAEEEMPVQEETATPLNLEGPQDRELPFFAYGVFKPGELAFFQLQEFVLSDRSGEIPGSLLLRDGLPILDNSQSGSVSGVLLDFAPGRGPDAYARISAMEPGSQYRWAVTTAEGECANVLVGRSPHKGSVYLEEAWSSWSDPLFTEALQVVIDTLNEPKTGSLYTPLFRLQMAYLLLWSSMEHYISLRYCLSDKATEKIWRLADEEAFARGLLKHVTRRDDVYRADRPRGKEVLDANSPLKSLRYYYQLRSNITHRGKRALRDCERLRSSLEELLAIFQDVLETAEKDAGRPA